MVLRHALIDPESGKPRTYRRPTPRTKTNMKALLDAYAQTGNLRASCQAAGIDRNSHYYWLTAYPEYREQFAVAHEDAIERLEGEARRRAVAGVEKPVFYRGQQVGTVREPSDLLLMFLLRALRPEKYRERHELNVITEDALDRQIDELAAELERRAAITANAEPAALPEHTDA